MVVYNVAYERTPMKPLIAVLIVLTTVATPVLSYAKAGGRYGK